MVQNQIVPDIQFQYPIMLVLYIQTTSTNYEIGKADGMVVKYERLTSAEMVDPNLGKHGVVFNLGLAEWWAIVRYQNQLPCNSQQNLNHP